MYNFFFLLVMLEVSCFAFRCVPTFSISFICCKTYQTIDNGIMRSAIIDKALNCDFARMYRSCDLVVFTKRNGIELYWHAHVWRVWIASTILNSLCEWASFFVVDCIINNLFYEINKNNLWRVILDTEDEKMCWFQEETSMLFSRKKKSA